MPGRLGAVFGMPLFVLAGGGMVNEGDEFDPPTFDDFRTGVLVAVLLALLVFLFGEPAVGAAVLFEFEPLREVFLTGSGLLLDVLGLRGDPPALTLLGLLAGFGTAAPYFRKTTSRMAKARFSLPTYRSSALTPSMRIPSTRKKLKKCPKLSNFCIIIFGMP